VIHQALLRIAQGCKSRISREVTLPWLTVRYTVLRSRWCQRGVNGTLAVPILAWHDELAIKCN
jgi:hypothetical protein